MRFLLESLGGSARSFASRVVAAAALGAACAPALASDPAAPPAAAGMAVPAAGTLACATDAASRTDWTVLRVGGEAGQPAYSERDGWSYDVCRIPTPLPVGYPAPTPPSAIELKKYPSVRRAEVSSEGSPSAGRGFWPLYRHIERHKIDMTSPVEMDYSGLADGKTRRWTMSFLYRTPELRETGGDAKDQRVLVRDTEPMTVIALGARGSYGNEAVAKLLEQLEGWLESNPAWERAGEYRALFYNGPEMRSSRRWLEVQIPVRPRAVSTGTSAAAMPTSPVSAGEPAAEAEGMPDASRP